MKPIKHLIYLVAGVLSFSAHAEELRFLPESCEIKLARSAAPAHLQEEAGIYVFDKDGYRLHTESRNGFTCIINRDHPLTIKPTCFDAEGSRKILPKILYFGSELVKGTDVTKINAAISEKFKSGELERAGPGVAYMMSHFNRPLIGPGKIGFFPPHVMFYAPDISSFNIGSDRETIISNYKLPFVAYQGPHGFMIVRYEETARPEENRIMRCPDWLHLP